MNTYEKLEVAEEIAIAELGYHRIQEGATPKTYINRMTNMELLEFIFRVQDRFEE